MNSAKPIRNSIDLRSRTELLNDTLENIRKWKDEHPEDRTAYSKHPASILNAYREGDISFTQAIEVLQSLYMPQWFFTSKLALKILRSWNYGSAGFDSIVVSDINAWVDRGMKGPLPWPDSPFFAEWAAENGLVKCDGAYIGVR